MNWFTTKFQALNTAVRGLSLWKKALLFLVIGVSSYYAINSTILGYKEAELRNFVRMASEGEGSYVTLTIVSDGSLPEGTPAVMEGASMQFSRTAVLKFPMRELKAVAAHEMAHVTSTSTKFYGGVSNWFSSDWASRKSEMAADSAAVLILEKNGLTRADLEAALIRVYESNAAKGLAPMGTHPQLADRLNNIRSR